jgi:hypothetical protein
MKYFNEDEKYIKGEGCMNSLEICTRHFGAGLIWSVLKLK